MGVANARRPARLRREGGGVIQMIAQNSSLSSQGEPVNAKGKVKFFNETKGYGFFTRDDGSGDVFVHRSDLPAEIGLLYEGQTVTFDIEMTTRGLRAVKIALAEVR
jgi:CspA family cold shock protein